jgi:alpha-tubulin suppressor-like RCC1 family protein
MCRGVGQQGQLGHNNLSNAAEPTHIASLTREQHTIAAVTCGIAHTFFLTDAGGLLACGQNIYGALGMDTSAEAVLVPTVTRVNFQEESVPGQGQGASRIVHISCGGAHTAVIDSRGRLYTTGSNTCGQLGAGNFNDFSCSFSQVTVFVGEASSEVGALRDLQTREEVYGRGELPVCAYVSCGEEFTAVISRDHSVYTVGLGLGECGFFLFMDVFFCTVQN